VIRRLFWLTLGAGLGVAGYRRATALARGASSTRRARDAVKFVADVRDGMALYMERHPGRVSSTLGSHRGDRRAGAPLAGPADSSGTVKDGR
jgi:hypothetical protein